MTIVFLPTDLLLLLLPLFTILFLYSTRHRRLSAPWRRIAQDPLAVASSVVLIVYMLIAVTDSIHFKYTAAHATKNNLSPAVTRSALDMALNHLPQHAETTYSAPFSAYSLVKDMTTHADGKITWQQARLKHGGHHLNNITEEQRGDILKKIAIGTLYGIIFSLAAVFLTVLLIALWKQHSFISQCKNRLATRNRSAFLAYCATVSGIIVLASISIYLSYDYHILGTDKVGQDIFYQSIKSIRTGVIIGTLTSVIMLPFAVILGVIAGYMRGIADDCIQYLYTTLNSIPSVLLIGAAALILDVYIENHADQFTSIEQRTDIKLLMLCVILGTTSWTGLCRLIRGETLKLRELGYISAAKALGSSTVEIMRCHLLPNVMHLIIIFVAIDFSYLVLAEAVLAYIDIGVDPSTPSWGNMINSARLELARDPVVWWSLAAAFIFMLGLVLPANILSSKIQHAFDPHNAALRR